MQRLTNLNFLRNGVGLLCKKKCIKSENNSCVFLRFCHTTRMKDQESKFRNESEVEEIIKSLVEQGWDADELDELDGYGGLKQWLSEGYEVKEALEYASQCC